MEGKKVVFAIDDNAFQLKLYKEMLVPRYDLRVAKNAAAALSFLNANTVDVILLDIEMPDISGFEFFADIRKVPSCMNVPVIIVSGNTGDEFLGQARKTGAADVLVKPVTPEVLVAVIEKALTA